MLILDRKRLLILCSLFVILVVLFTDNLLNSASANEIENVKLTSSISVYSSGDKSSDDVVWIDGNNNNESLTFY